MGREITVVRGIFKHAFDADLIDRPVKFGPMFKVPSKAKQRKHRAKQEQANGQKVFEAAEIRAMLNAADVQLRAMILLGINGALGNTDCANLPFAALDLKKAWLDYARVKTGVDRRVPLWPETVAALEAAIAARPQPKDPADANVVFVTKFGQRWVRYQVTEEKRFGKKVIKPKFDDAVAKAAAKLLNKLGIKRHRLGFYALRHTFETIAGGSKDQAAVDAIMGHVDPSMAATHRHGIDDARLHAVVDHVRAWLFPKVDGKIS
jgi:integrase